MEIFDSTKINNLIEPANGWYHIEKGGDHIVDYGGGNEILRISPEAIDRMVEEFNSRKLDGPGILIDGDHLSHDMDKDTRALGWLKQLSRYDDPETETAELYGYVEWTPRGLQMLKDKEYVQSSTEYDGMVSRNGVYEPEMLTGFALTNRPRICGKRPLVNRESSPPREDNKPVEGQTETKPENNMAEEKDKDFEPSDELDKEDRVLLDTVLDKMDTTRDQLEGKIDELLDLKKRYHDAENAEVEKAYTEIENAMSEEEKSELTDEGKEDLKNTLRSPNMRKIMLNRYMKKESPRDENKRSYRAPLANRTYSGYTNPAARGDSDATLIRNRAKEIMQSDASGKTTWSVAFTEATREINAKNRKA